MSPALKISERTRRRALALGETGVTWLAGLDELVRDVAAEWGLSIDHVVAGGTESFAATVRTADGQDAVLKIAIPGLDPTAGELRTLLMAQGRGYATVLRHDAVGRDATRAAGPPARPARPSNRRADRGDLHHAYGGLDSASGRSTVYDRR